MPASPTRTRPSTAGRTTSTTTSASSPRARTLRPVARYDADRNVMRGGTRADDYSSCWHTDLSAPAAGLPDGTSSVVSTRNITSILVRQNADDLHRGWYLPSQARPVDNLLKRGEAYSDYADFENLASDCHSRLRVHVSYRSSQCSSDSYITFFVPAARRPQRH